MKISASFLSVKKNLKANIEKLDKTNIDYLHLDIMDGLFVPNKTWNIDEVKDLLTNTTKEKDVHLMVKDVKKYIDEFTDIKPKFITFHYESANNILELIYYLKSLNIGVGLSIKPNTKVDEIKDYLKHLDLVLVMSVEPGLGGQKFIEESISKIDELYQLRENNHYYYVIEVDGGINDETIKECSNADISVVGSFITNGDYKLQLKKLK